MPSNASFAGAIERYQFMQRLTTIDAVKHWRGQPGTIGLVPMAKNIHAGHLALIAAARVRCDRVMVAMFADPLWIGSDNGWTIDLRAFDANHDAAYDDLARAGVDAIFVPRAGELFPAGDVRLTSAPAADVTATLCGGRRPGYLEAVASIVIRILNIVAPDVAFFGENNYQQLVVIRRAVAALCPGVTVESVATVRAEDGLACSSRNRDLDATQRREAPALSWALKDVAERLHAGHRDYRALEARGWSQLVDAGFAPEYFEIRDADLGPADDETQAFRIFGAGYLGGTCLIDNMGVDLAEFRIIS